MCMETMLCHVVMVESGLLSTIMCDAEESGYLAKEGEKKGAEGKKEEPPSKKKRFRGFKEDPFIYCKEGDEAVSKKSLS